MRQFVLLPSNIQFQYYAFCYLLSKLKCQLNIPSVATVAMVEGVDCTINRFDKVSMTIVPMV